MSYDPRTHGVSFSMLEDFMNCRQMATYRAEGIQSRAPSMPLTFGTIVHDVMAQGHIAMTKGKKLKIKEYVKISEALWRKNTPRASVDAVQIMEQALLFAEVVMPLYFEYWADFYRKVKWLQVEDFGRVELVVGDSKIPFNFKMDGVYSTGKTIWLHEQKTHSRWDEAALMDRLPFSLQIVAYLIALREYSNRYAAGVNYSIIRRPNLRQGNVETLPAFGERIKADIRSRPDFYFVKFEVGIDQKEQVRAGEYLYGLIKDFLDWHDGKVPTYRNTSQCENKYGRCTYLPICARGDMNGFTKRERGAWRENQ